MEETTKKVATKKVAPKKVAKSNSILGTGRRKSSIARVRLIPNGKGLFVINGKNIDEYFALGTLKYVATQALDKTESTGKFDVYVTVNGGGLTGQAGAIRLGVARALNRSDENLHGDLKKAGFLTRDARAKERKKPGLKKARKAPQFRKR